MNNQPARLAHFDGLRGVAACTVFISHFLLAFYPATYTGVETDSHTHLNIESWLRNSPINLLFNGKFSVCVFFAISGFVLSFRFFPVIHKPTIIVATAKRYPRLMILVWVSAALSFVLLRLGIFNTPATAAITHSLWLNDLFRTPVTFYEMIRNIGYEQLIIKDVPIPLNPVLWTIATELKGSFLVFSVLLVLPAQRWRFFIYLGLIAWFSKSHYVLFLFGVLLADISTGKFSRKIPAWAWLLLVIVTLVFGSYKPASFCIWWNWMDFVIPLTDPVFIGVAALLVITCYHPGFQRLLSRKPPQWLGSISYSLYICHLIVLCAFVCPVFYFTYTTTAHYHLSTFIAFLSAITLTFAASVYVFGPVDRWSIKLSNRFGDWIKKWLSLKQTGDGQKPSLNG